MGLKLDFLLNDKTLKDLLLAVVLYFDIYIGFLIRNIKYSMSMLPRNSKEYCSSCVIKLLVL